MNRTVKNSIYHRRTLFTNGSPLYYEIRNSDIFSLKEEDLDSQQGVIDFSLYLRSKRESCNDNISVGAGDKSVLDTCPNVNACPPGQVNLN